MLRTFILGSVLAVVAAVLVAFGTAFGLELSEFALLGASCGAVLGLVPDRSPLGRLGGFVAGFLLAWLGYALRAGFFPDTNGGRAVAAFVVVLAITVVAGLTGGALPLWSCLLGAAAMIGAYEVTFQLAPTAFTSESVTAATTVALAAAVGFLVAVVVAELLHGPDDTRSLWERAKTPDSGEPVASDLSIVNSGRSEA